MPNQQTKLDRLCHYLEQDTDNLNLLQDIIETCCQQGDREKAWHYIERMEAVDAASAQNARGLMHLHFGELTEATEVFAAILAQTDSIGLRYNLSFCYFAQQAHDKARSTLLPVVENHSEDFPVGQLLMAQIEYHRQQWSSAKSLLEKYLKQHPQSDEALGLLSLIYFDTEELTRAQSYAQKALAINAQNLQAQAVQIYLKIGSGTCTTAEIENLLQRSPQDGRLYYALGNIQMLGMQMEKAIASFNKAASLLPDFIENWLALGWAQLMADALDEAGQSFNQILARDTNHPEAHGGLAIVAVLQGDKEEAKNRIQQAKTLDANSFFYLLAQALLANSEEPAMAKGYFDKAMANMEKATNTPLNPTLAQHLLSKTVH